MGGILTQEPGGIPVREQDEELERWRVRKENHQQCGLARPSVRGAKWEAAAERRIRLKLEDLVGHFV